MDIDALFPVLTATIIVVHLTNSIASPQSLAAPKLVVLSVLVHLEMVLVEHLRDALGGFRPLRQQTLRRDLRYFRRAFALLLLGIGREGEYVLHGLNFLIGKVLFVFLV